MTRPFKVQVKVPVVRSAWEQSQFIAWNTNFNPRTFTTLLTDLAPNTNYFFRFYATNASGEAWAAASWQVSTVTLNPPDVQRRRALTSSLQIFGFP
jgi:hypothetical protein